MMLMMLPTEQPPPLVVHPPLYARPLAPTLVAPASASATVYGGAVVRALTLRLLLRLQ
jgi:mRNA-degrading endonuclease toxin of MazEF toxin-antitoxin module